MQLFTYAHLVEKQDGMAQNVSTLHDAAEFMMRENHDVIYDPRGTCSFSVKSRNEQDKPLPGSDFYNRGERFQDQ